MIDQLQMTISVTLFFYRLSDVEWQFMELEKSAIAIISSGMAIYGTRKVSYRYCHNQQWNGNLWNSKSQLLP
jgi:hypothetical protein